MKPWQIRLSFFIIYVIFAIFLTNGDGKFLYQWEYRNTAFDSLGQSLLLGEAYVDFDTINAEAHLIDGRAYTYFAPFPAVIRIIPNFLMPFMYGRWARVSCFLAASLILIAFLKILGLQFPPGKDSPQQRAPLTSILLFAFALGSPLFYLMSCAYIYHESILWGLCGSMWALYFLLSQAREGGGSPDEILGFSLAVSVALLSRITFALPYCIFIALFAVAGLAGMLFRKNWVRNVPVFNSLFSGQPARGEVAIRTLTFLIPVAAAVLFYGWYNFKRYGSVFTFADFQSYAIFSAPAKEFIAETGAFSIKRLPFGFLNYFGFTKEFFIPRAPFLQLASVHSDPAALYLQDYREWVISLLLVSPWLILCALFGLTTVLQRRDRGWAMIMSGCFLVQWCSVMMYYFVTQRYQADFMPLLIFLSSFHWARLAGTEKKRRVFWVLLICCLAVISIAATFLSTSSAIAYHNWGMNWLWQDRWQRLLDFVNASMGISWRP